eukprot:3993718-Amphidinium_carterae.2
MVILSFLPVSCQRASFEKWATFVSPEQVNSLWQDLASSFGESHPSSKPTVNGSKANTPRQPWQQAPKPKQRPRPKAAAGGGGHHS